MNVPTQIPSPHSMPELSIPLHTNYFLSTQFASSAPAPYIHSSVAFKTDDPIMASNTITELQNQLATISKRLHTLSLKYETAHGKFHAYDRLLRSDPGTLYDHMIQRIEEMAEDERRTMKLSSEKTRGLRAKHKEIREQVSSRFRVGKGC